MMNSGESGFKMMVVLMILSLGYLGREYLGLRSERDNLEQAYVACVNANRSLQSQSSSQVARLQELEVSAQQWEPALQALQAQKEILLKERDDSQATVVQLQALNALLTSQLEQAQSSSVADQQVLRQDRRVSMGTEARQSNPEIYLPGVGMLNLSGVGWQVWLCIILAGVALGGFGIGRLTPDLILPNRQVSVRLTRSEARLIARLRRQDAGINKVSKTDL
jgi:hypothetical protein